MTTTDEAVMSAAQQAVHATLADPNRVSGEQAAFAVAHGDIFLSACPGSGKTRSVGLRLAYNASFCPQRSIAALSHTNTAERAIAEAARDLVALPYHYFVGTLHTFLLTYVVYPFGHLYMGCPRSPEVVAEDRDWPADLGDTSVDDWTRFRIKAWRFEADADRGFTYRHPRARDWPNGLTAEIVVERKSSWAREQKKAYWKRGLLSFSDVLYVAMRVLQEFANIRNAVAARFDELVLDEAQDTNDVQLACVRLLRQPDIRPRLVAVGDLDQAVYEWGRAKPAQLLQVIGAEGLTRLRLSANYRSSQRVCRVTHRFSTRSQPETARGEHASCDLVPQLWNADAEPAVEQFRRRLDATGIDEQDSAVLVRTNAQADALNDVTSRDSWSPLLGVLGRAAHARDIEGLSREVFETLRRAVATVAYKAARPRDLGGHQLERLHAATCRLLDDLPPAEGNLRTFNLAARDVLGDAATWALDGETPLSRPRSLLKDDAKLERYDARVAFAPPPSRLARTIHDAKGESIDAVLVIARPEDLAAWTCEIRLAPRPSVLLEDTRLVYVALSRAQRLLVLATPGPSQADIALLDDVGFAFSP